MQEYKITADKLKELKYLICSGYEIDEINTYMGYAEIKLHMFDDWREQETIIMETI